MAKLAINGGPKCVTEPVKIKWPIVDERDAEHVAEVVRAGRGGWCRLGLDDGEVSTFEREWAAYQDAKYALAVNNGTCAIECALSALGLRPGDEVIVPAITFVASASGVLMARGIPIFADVIQETCQIDPDDVERKITERTTGILVVHYGGYPVDLTRIKDVAKRHGLFVLEDCAHGQGSEWEGRKVGAIGDVGTFSFQGSKAITCGEGGAIVTDRQDVYEACWAYHHIGRTLGAAKYAHETIGPNLRLSEVQAALLRTQLEKLQGQVERRMATARLISDGLKEVPGVEPLLEDPRITQRGYYFYIMRFDEETWGCSKDDFVKAFRAEGVSMSSGYSDTVYELPVFANNRYDSTGWPVLEGEGHGRITEYTDCACPNAELVAHHQHLTVTNHSLLYPEFAEKALAVFGKLWENRGEVTQSA